MYSAATRWICNFPGLKSETWGTRICGCHRSAILGYGGDIVMHVYLQELVEEGAVLEHGGAHVFGGDLGAGGALGDGVGRAVVFDDAGMVDGDVGGTLLEVGDGIAASVHE
jgi:hypothetical protein